MSGLKTLVEHNEEARQRYQAIENAQKPHPNGIACPKCGSQLWDTSPQIILSTYPPQTNIHCPTCTYQGYRLA